MKTSIIICNTLVVMLCLPVFSSGVGAAPAPGQGNQASASKVEESQFPIYTPRNQHKMMPRARVGGSLRGTEGKDPEIVALVPDHVGLTVKQAPSLNWFLSKPTSLPIRFTLIDTRTGRAISLVHLRDSQSGLTITGYRGRRHDRAL